MMTAPALTPEQTRALFDILSHHETYAEIEGFRWADAVTSYGFPFTRDFTEASEGLAAGKSTGSTPAYTAPSTPRVRTPVPSEDTKPLAAAAVADMQDPDGEHAADPEPSSSPLLRSLLTRFVLPLPGVKNLRESFWQVRIQGILARLGDADLSESYDKGTLGLRKTLATGASALIEMVGRGALGGVKRKSRRLPAGETMRVEYDRTKADDLERAWEDVVEGLVYGDLMGDMFDHVARTDDLEGHSPAVKAAAEYAIIHIATILHHVFVLSPEGQYFLKYIENVYRFVPYTAIKQALRFKNTTTMINAMTRLLLFKLSMTSLTNLVGLTQNADDGMNLLQRIISTTLMWDASEFRKSATKIEKAKERPSDEALQAIRLFIGKTREQHEEVRRTSVEQSQSIITAIFNASEPELNASLSESKHAQCLEYYSANLSVRDRDRIEHILCRHVPDHFTQMVWDGVKAYEPMIGRIHEKVDLREHLDATMDFIEDFIKVSKPKKATGAGLRAVLNGEAKTVRMPTVEDYVDLLMKNRGEMYRWVHALGSRSQDIWAQFRQWAVEAVVKLRQEMGGKTRSDDQEDEEEDEFVDAQEEVDSTGDDVSRMDEDLNKLFQALPSSTQGDVLSALNAHAQYLTTLTNTSHGRLQRIIDNTTAASSPSPAEITSSMAGPGVYLSRWQGLLDETLITPATPSGKVRHGRDVNHSLAMGKTVVEEAKGERERVDRPKAEPAPDVGVVVRELGDGFHRVLQGMDA